VIALLISTTAWTCIQLVLAVVISVPPLNVFVHGTLAIPAHSMGTLIGIDTMVLLGAGLWLAHERAGEDSARRTTALAGVLLINAGLLLLWLALLWVGVVSGARMATNGTLPWFGAFPSWLGPSLVLAGVLLLAGIVPLAAPKLRRYRT
jgi:nitric oxide reductase subunit B